MSIIRQDFERSEKLIVGDFLSQGRYKHGDYLSVAVLGLSDQ